MNENELRIAKISQLLNTAIKSKNSADYNKALSLLESSEHKPTLKQVLDAQVADNKRIKEEAKLQEYLEDRKRLEKARLTLESEEKRKVTKKENINKELKESWTEDISLKELQRELDLLRNSSDCEEDEVQEKTEEELEEEEKQKMQEIIKRYEKTFGRIKGLDSNRSKTGSIAGKSIVSSVPASRKSKQTEFSTISQKEAYEKLKKLDEDEERIRREKDELMKFLELRSQSSKCSSRPATVASLVARQEEKVVKKENLRELPIIIENEVKENKKDRDREKQRPSGREKRHHDESIDELFKNL